MCYSVFCISVIKMFYRAIKFYYDKSIARNAEGGQSYFSHQSSFFVLCLITSNSFDSLYSLTLVAFLGKYLLVA